MKIQEIVSDVRSRVENTGKLYQDAFKAYVDAQRKAVGVVTKNGQTLANTEIGAAKNVFAAAKASFDKARADGVRKVARNPQTYVPNGRDQIVSAYKDTIDLLVRTGNELTDVLSSGYKSVLGKLGSAAKGEKTTTSKTATTRNKAAPAKSAASTTATAAKKPVAAKSTAKRKTASTRETTEATASKRTNTATASKPAASTAITSTANNSDSSAG